MDSIHSTHSSPFCTRNTNESPDYDSSPECCSVCDHDLTETDTSRSPEDWDQCIDRTDDNDNKCDLQSDAMNNHRNNVVSGVSAVNTAGLIDHKISAFIMNRYQRGSQHIINDLNDLKQSNSDVESQKGELKRNKSLIKRLYSGSLRQRRVPVATRLSILGRPIICHSLNEVNFYKERVAVYNFLQRPSGWVAISYHIFVSFVVFICLLLTIFSTISDFETYATIGLKIMDGFVVALFSSEFIARLWSSSCVSHYQGWTGKLRFLRNPFRLIDIIVIITSCIVVFFDTQSHKLFIYFRGFRFFQVFQMLRLEHRFRPWRLMASVVWAQREHLAITTYMGFLALLFISFTIYFVEKDRNPAFDSIASSMWWGVVTLCTVGYGDMSPVTPFGKFLSCICIIIGVSIFALPAGILGTGLALKVQEQQRVRQLGKRREPAARFIQWTWRCYAASESSTSTVTWKTHIRANRKDDLTRQEKTAIRFIRIVKYYIARRRFHTALKPYDIKDVLEQYAAGHADVLGRVKHMQSRINAIQSSVNTNMKSLTESKVSLSVRMANMESITEDLQNKMSEMLSIQSKDKAIIHTLVSILSHKTNCDINIDHNLVIESSANNKTRRNSF